MPAVTFIEIKRCPRCGKNHGRMVRRPFHGDPPTSAGTRYDGFARCPLFDEPILIVDLVRFDGEPDPGSVLS
jgi:hypothetical protein